MADAITIIFKYLSCGLAAITFLYAMVTVPKLTVLSGKSEHVYYAVVLLVPLSLAQATIVWTVASQATDAYGVIKLIAIAAQHLVFIRILYCIRKCGNLYRFFEESCGG